MEPGCREVRAPGSSFYIAYEYRLDRTACIDRADVSARHRTRPAGLRRCGPPSGGRCRGAAGPIGAAAAHRLRRGAGLPPAARLFSGAAARRLLSGRQFVERLFDAGQGRRGPFGDADRFEQPHHALHDSAGDGFRRAFRRGAPVRPSNFRSGNCWCRTSSCCSCRCSAGRFSGIGGPGRHGVCTSCWDVWPSRP